MPKRERASARLIREVVAQPSLLSGTFVAATDLIAIAVERDDVPRAEIETIVPRGRVACARTEVAEVSRRTRRVVFMVARRWIGDRLQLAPRQVVTVREP